MKKLSKEQAQWLIELIKAKNFGYGFSSGMHDKTMDFKDVIQIITQCTEQEFPELMLKDEIGTFRYGVFLNMADDGIKLISGHNQEFTLSRNEFKAFANGVAAIKTWIEQQEQQ